MIKNLEMIVVVPMAVIKNILAIADIIVLGVAIGTMGICRLQWLTEHLGQSTWGDDNHQSIYQPY